MVLNTAQFFDNLISAPAVCGYVLLVLFFTGEVVTHLLGPGPSAGQSRRRSMAIYAVPAPRADRWTTHRVAVLESSDRHESTESMRDWPRLVSQAAVAEAAPVEADASKADRIDSEVIDLQRQTFTRWLIEQGRLDEWSADDGEHLELRS